MASYADSVSADEALGRDKRKISPTLGSSPDGKAPKRPVGFEKLEEVKALLCDQDAKLEKVKELVKPKTPNAGKKADPAENNFASAIVTLLSALVTSSRSLHDAVSEVADSLDENYSELSQSVVSVSANLDKCQSTNQNLENTQSSNKLIDEMRESDCTVKVIDLPVNLSKSPSNMDVQTSIKDELKNKCPNIAKTLDHSRIIPLIPKKKGQNNSSSTPPSKISFLIKPTSKYAKFDILNSIKENLPGLRTPFHFPAEIYKDVVDIRKKIQSSQFKFKDQTWSDNKEIHISVRPSNSLKTLGISVRKDSSSEWVFLHAMPIPSMNRDIKGNKSTSWGPIIFPNSPTTSENQSTESCGEKSKV